MGYNFLNCTHNQMYLIPVSMRDWLPKDHLAWFIIDTVNEFDLTPFYHKYHADGWGRAAYEPGMMVSLLLYAYCLGIRSARQIERACEENVAFRVIAANQKPDYSTICRFRKENEELIAARIEAKVGTMLGDAGYYNEDAILQAQVDPQGPELLIATIKNSKQRQAMKGAVCSRGRVPNNATVKERMERKLLRKRGKRLYKLRSQTVEPVFGQIKEGRGCGRFLRQGLARARSEWRLMCTTHNLLKLWRSGKLHLHLAMQQRQGCWAQRQQVGTLLVPRPRHYLKGIT